MKAMAMILTLDHHKRIS